MPDLISIARTALLEITPDATIGAPSGQVEEAGATSVTFLANMAGYPGWHWTVSIATLDDAEPSVLEVELMPGNGALLAPDWVPWSERLADYEAAQEALAVDPSDDELEGAELSDDETDDEDDDSDDSDDESEDDDIDADDLLGSDVLHGGDLDGVDIDEPTDEGDDESDDDESDDEESDDDFDDAEDERSY